jgi:hypothetical protein
LGAAETQKAFLDAQTIHDGWEANYGDIKSMKFKSSQKLIRAEGPRIERLVRLYSIEKIEDGKRVYVRSTNNEAGFEEEEHVIVMSFDGSVGKRYQTSRKLGEIYRGLKGSLAEFSNHVKLYVLAERIRVDKYVIDPPIGKDDPRWKSIEAYLKFKETVMKDFPEGVPMFTYHFMEGRQFGQVRVLPDLESVAGEMCHVLEIISSQDEPGWRYWVAHEKGMLPMRFMKYYKGGDYTKIEVQEVASAKTDVGEVWYPRVAIREMKRRGRHLKYELRIDEFVPHIKVPPETFDIDFPDGTRVVDRITNIEYTKGEDG